jgi:Tfp pilus assembly protein PilX
MRTKSPAARQRGAAAVLAMIFLLLFSTLTVAMYGMAGVNVQSAENLSDAARAQQAAESGVQWMAYRFNRMARPKTTVGNINPAAANVLWPAIKTAIQTDLASMLDPSERTVTSTAKSISTAPIRMESNGAQFQITVNQHPLYAGDPLDERYLQVVSTGTYRGATRTVTMDFKIDKKVKFAVVGKVPIQLGRNTIVEGPVAMATANKFPPILMLSDFMHFDNTLKTRLEGWNNYLKGSHTVNGTTVPNHAGYDNRISVNNATEFAAATAAGYTDYNGDAYIDEFDMFLQRFDANGDRAVTEAEFTNPSTGKLYDADFFRAIDQINGPMYTGDPVRTGFQDGIIDNRDGYAKVRGQLMMACTADAWSANLASSGKVINDMIQGTVVPTENAQIPVKFGANSADIFDLSPTNFEECALNFKARAGSAAGTPINTGTLIANTTLTTGMANGGTVTERTPFGSTSYQATYRRPVYRNMTFRNVIIPKGTNALFDNCKFEGVTFVEGERDITRSNGSTTTSPSDGMSWAQRKVSGDTFSKDKVLLGSGTPSSGQTITEGSRKGNNLRFNNCTFEGPIAGNYATAYTHFANSWEFTGATMFDNKVDETATIVSPQVNIEMGSFTNPTSAPSTLKGVVVAGNIDIRGVSNVDGSIIVTGDGAGNTTLAYFGASDSDTNAGANPEGGYGRLNIRYNPYRALPDGINVAIDITPEPDTYAEGLPCPD